MFSHSMIHIRDRGVGSDDVLPKRHVILVKKTCILQRRPAVDCITVTTCPHQHCGKCERMLPKLSHHDGVHIAIEIE